MSLCNVGSLHELCNVGRHVRLVVPRLDHPRKIARCGLDELSCGARIHGDARREGRTGQRAKVPSGETLQARLRGGQGLPLDRSVLDDEPDLECTRDTIWPSDQEVHDALSAIDVVSDQTRSSGMTDQMRGDSLSSVRECTHTPIISSRVTPLGDGLFDRRKEL